MHVFDSISSNIYEFLSISSSAVFVFGDFVVHIRTCSPILVELIDLVNSVIIFLSSDFLSNSQQDAPFHRIAYDYSNVDWDGLCDHLRDVPWEGLFKLSASAAASEFCEWVQVGIDAYIPHRKYQVKPHSSPWFSAACAAAIVHRNHFFCLYQKDKSSDSKVKFIQASNHCKRVLEAAKLAYVIYLAFAENASKNFNLDDSGISLPLFSSRTNLRLIFL